MIGICMTMSSLLNVDRYRAATIAQHLARKYTVWRDDIPIVATQDASIDDHRIYTARVGDQPVGSARQIMNAAQWIIPDRCRIKNYQVSGKSER